MKKKGFTLIELIAVITILSIIILLAVPNLLKLIGTNKEKSLERIKNIIVSAGRNYAVDNNIEGPTNIPLSKLCKGYIDCPINNPINNVPLNGRVKIDEYNVFSYIDAPINNCVFEGDLVQGAIYTNGQYEYHYKQRLSDSGWENNTTDGWGVALTNEAKISTNPINTELCTHINNKSIFSMMNMFRDSNATEIDLSSFNTSDVVTMYRMFFNSKTTSIDLSSFDTSKVYDMSGMFQNTKFTEIDLSSIDTSNVLYMGYMFASSVAGELDLSDFNTSKVTEMPGMFYNTNALNLDLSGFDTSNVTHMFNMFVDSKATNINLSSFDTSKVTSFEGMFGRTKVDKLDLSNFNTSSVTNMVNMFLESNVSEINLNSFNTSIVTNMQGMFAGTSNLNVIDLSSFDMSNVTNTDLMFWNSNATIGYARTQTDANVLNSSTNKPSNLIFRTKIPNEYQIVTYIQSSGTQYINTNYSLWQNNNWKIELKFDVSEFYNYNNMFGTLNVTDTNNEIWIADDANYYVRVGGVAKTSIATLSLNTPYVIVHDNTGSNLLNYVNGTLVSTLTKANTSVSNPLGFGHREGGLYLKGKIYYLRFWNGNALVRNFVPCFRKSDNVIGLYDTVSETFYTNAGTGVFTKGTNI